jgi:hypothetical protein
MTDWWLGFGHAGALREMVPRLPRLRHRVILGQAREAERDFCALFDNTPENSSIPRQPSTPTHWWWKAS